MGFDLVLVSVRCREIGFHATTSPSRRASLGSTAFASRSARCREIWVPWRSPRAARGAVRFGFLAFTRAARGVMRYGFHGVDLVRRQVPLDLGSIAFASRSARCREIWVPRH